MLNDYEQTQLSTSTVEAHLQKLLLKYGKVQTNDTTRSLNEKDINYIQRYNMIQDIVFRFCFVTTMERGIKLQNHCKHF